MTGELYRYLSARLISHTGTFVEVLLSSESVATPATR